MASKADKLVVFLHDKNLLGLLRRPTYAFVSKLPETGDLSAVDFTRLGPIKTEAGKEAFLFGDLAYDDDRRELIFAYAGFPNPNDISVAKADYLLRIWRIGQDLRLENIEDTNLLVPQMSLRISARRAWNTYSLLVWDNLIYVGTTMNDEKNATGLAAPNSLETDINYGFKPCFAQRGVNSKWIPRPIRSVDNAIDTNFCTFVRAPSSFKYTYFAALGHPSSAYKDVIHLYSIRASKFGQAGADSDALWTGYKVLTDFPLNRGFTTLVTSDATSDKTATLCRLYIFATGTRNQNNPNDNSGGFAFSYIPLATDGSITNATADGVVKCLGKQIIKLPSRTSGQHPCVVLWKQKTVMVMVQGDLEFHLYVGNVGDDGSLPKAADWKAVQVKFKTATQYDGFLFGGAAVVPPDFIKDSAV